MKEFIKNAKTGLTIGVFASFVIIISLVIYTKARQSSSSGVTVDNSSPASLYVGNNETLTSAKRNRLVQKANREEVATSDTALFDTSCERRRQLDNGIYDNFILATNVRANGTRIQALSTGPARQYINYNTKTTLSDGTSTWPILHIRKKCP